MSNKLINAVIALVEDRPQDAREMLRSPELKISISEVQGRLNQALKTREEAAQIEALKNILRTTLRLIDADKAQPGLGPDNKEAYLAGVTDVERIIDDAISELGT